MHYRNPVIPGFHPDPSVCCAGDDYFLVCSSCEYFPGVPIFHSKDLIHWRHIGYCLSRASQLDLSRAYFSRGIYAPTIRHHDGMFYVITTNVSDRGNFIIRAENPLGTWSDPVWMDVPGIDPDLFFDDNGSAYLSVSNRSDGYIRISQCKVDVGTGRCLSPLKDIWEGSGGFGPEAPHIYKIDNQYYLMIAEGGTEYGHIETISRSARPDGPFEPCPRNPILTHRSSGSPIQGVGHADLIQAHTGSWWAVCLGFRFVGYQRYHFLGRETYLAPVIWDDCGWPVIGDNGRIGLDMEAETLPAHPWPRPAARDNFDAAELALCWNFIGNPGEGTWSLVERPGALRLKGQPETLDAMNPAPVFVGRRQCHFDVKIAASLEFDPMHEGEEAGLTTFQNLKHHYEIAVAMRNGNRVVLVRRRIGSLSAIVAERELHSPRVELVIRGDRETYRFGFKTESQSEIELATGETRYLATEVGGWFTGVYLGMYATGNGRVCTARAFFDWFDYQHD
ncbi:MAG: glycoside hydrolase family 43 protein [Candidatus Zhuqueibacterota bacterium]